VNILNVELFQRKYFNWSQFFLYGFQPTHKPAQDQIRHFQNFQIFKLSTFQEYHNVT